MSPKHLAMLDLYTKASYRLIWQDCHLSILILESQIVWRGHILPFLDQPGSRGLLVLFGKPKGGYRFQAFAPGVLPCANCLGNAERKPGTPAFVPTIKDRELTIGWVRRAPDAVAHVKLVVAYDAKRNQLGLLTDETVAADRATGKVSSRQRNYATGTVTTNGRQQEMEPRFIPLTRVSPEEY